MDVYILRDESQTIPHLVLGELDQVRMLIGEAAGDLARTAPLLLGSGPPILSGESRTFSSARKKWSATPSDTVRPKAASYEVFATMQGGQALSVGDRCTGNFQGWETPAGV